MIGLKHIRAQGGLTIAQDPNEAEHDSMPVTAISTGMVDWVLPVAQIAPKLLEFVQQREPDEAAAGNSGGGRAGREGAGSAGRRDGFG